MKIFTRYILALGLFLPFESQASFLTWVGGNASNKNTNWSPAAVPSSGDVAVFNNTPTQNTVNLSTGTFTLNTIFFPEGNTTQYTFDIYGTGKTEIVGGGVSNQSLIKQLFNISGLASWSFLSGSTAGANTNFNVSGAGAGLLFADTSKAGSSTFNAEYGGLIKFTDNSDGSKCKVILSGGALLDFAVSASADALNCSSDSSAIQFFNSSTAGNATFGISNSAITFNDSSSAGSSSINLAGSQATFNDTSTGSNAGLTLSGSSSLTINQNNSVGYLKNIDGTATVNLNSFNLTDNCTTATTFAGTISGTGQFIKAGTNSLTLTGTNTYSGGTLISAGNLVVNTSSLPNGNVIDNGMLTFNQSSNGTFKGNISGSGSLMSTGAGNLTLSGTNSYTGGTTITSGTLTGDTNSLQGSIIDNAKLFFSQSSNGTFVGSISGNGIVGTASTNTGQVNLVGTNNTYSGGTQILGGTLIVDTNSLPAPKGVVDNGVLNFNQTFAGTYSGNISGKGSLIKSGVSDLTLIGNNTYSGGTTVSVGTLTGDTNSLPPGKPIVDNATLVFNQTSNGTFSGAISGTGLVQKTGAGNLALTSTNSWSNGTLISQGTLTGNTFSLPVGGNITDNAALVFNQGFDGSFTGNISGPGSLTKTGIGNLILAPTAGTNSYSGGTTISQGTLTGDTHSIPNNRDIVDNAALVFNEAGVGTVSGNISGIGSVTMAGLGILALEGTNSWSGGTTVSSGTLVGNTVSFPPGKNIVTNASLVFEQILPGTFSGVISGTGTVTVGDAGPLTFSGANTYSGGTTIQGTLIASSATLPHGGPIVDNGFLIFDQAIADTFSGNISGTGAMTKTNVGNLFLSGTNSFSGGTTISQGALVGNATSLPAPGGIINNAALVFNQATTGTYSGNISGTGSLTKTNVGILTLSGNNTYSGGTIISQGTLVGSSASIPGGTIVDNTSLIFSQAATGTLNANISGSGNCTKQGAGTLILRGINTYVGGTQVLDGTLVGDTNSLQRNILDSSNLVFDQAFNGAFNGHLSGKGTLAKTNVGVLIFGTDQSAFIGPTSLIGGTLLLNSTIGGNVATAAGTTLLGVGTVKGNLSVDGIFSPGNGGSGTFQVNSNYSQSAQGTFNEQINGTQSGFLNVSGAASLAGALVVTFPVNNFSATTPYHLLHAGNGVTGQFSSITFPESNILSPVITYNPNDVILMFLVNFAPEGLTTNQISVSDQLDNFIDPVILNDLLKLSIPDLKVALDAMAGEQHTLMLVDSKYANRRFNRRLFDAVRESFFACESEHDCECECDDEDACFDNKVWLDFAGGRSFARGSINAKGYSANNFDVSAGYHFYTDENLLLGLAACYEHDRLDFKQGGSNSIWSAMGALYGLYQAENFYFFSDLIVGTNHGRVKRPIVITTLDLIAKSHPRVWQESFYVEFGTDFYFCDLVLQPFFGANFAAYQRSHIREHGAEPLNLEITKKNFYDLTTYLGSHFQWCLPKDFCLNMDAAWLHSFGRKRYNTHPHFEEFGSQFEILGTDFGRDSAWGTLNVSKEFGDQFQVFIEASGEIGYRWHAYDFVAGLSFRW